MLRPASSGLARASSALRARTFFGATRPVQNEGDRPRTAVSTADSPVDTSSAARTYPRNLSRDLSLPSEHEDL